MGELSREVTLVRLAEGETASTRRDEVAHEEPLELQLGGQSFAVLMRTPGHDEELGAGFLLTEGIIASLEELESLRHCTEVPSAEAEDNVLQIHLKRPIDLARFRRNLFASSSCGVCGKATLENALRTTAPLTSALRVRRDLLSRLPDALRAGQATFDATGGLHAAALFDTSGERLVVREDVGRHNAVDKVVGWALQRGASREDLVLLVSGRLSFELVQKAVAARIPVLAGISAPTSLAVRMAEALGVTLVGFVAGRRDERLRAPRAGTHHSGLKALPGAAFTAGRRRGSAGRSARKLASPGHGRGEGNDSSPSAWPRPASTADEVSNRLFGIESPCVRARASTSPGSGGRHQQVGGPPG